MFTRHRARHSPAAIAAHHAEELAAEREKTARAGAALIGLDATIADLRTRLTDATDARDRADARANELVEADVRADRLAAEVQELRAELANARAIHVPAPGGRHPDTETNQPISLQERGPLR